MKRITCNVLIWMGVSLILLGIIFPILWFTAPFPALENLITILSMLGGLFIPMGIILLIIAWIKWNSERKETERKETRKAQLEALRRGEVDMGVKGKMRKLK